MTKQLTIASDLDGTLADHARMKMQFAKKLGYILTKQDTSSDVMKTKMRGKDYKKITSMIYGTGSLHASVMPHARETVEKLIAEFGPIYIISRRGTGIEAEYGMKWIRAHLIPPFHQNNIFFVQDDAEKHAVAKKLGVSVYIDDKQEVLDQMSEIPYRILFDPHDTFPQSSYPRIHSWEELPSYIEKIVPPQ